MSYKSNIWKMYVFKFLSHFFLISGILVPFFTDWGGISFMQIMILQSIFVFSVFILEVPTGAVADYLGRKTSLILGAFSVGIAALVYSTYPNFWIFVLGEVLWALGVALMSGADQALIYDSLKKIKQEKISKKIFARFNSFEMAGIMIATAIGSVIAHYYGLRYSMMLIIFPLSLAFLIALSFKEPKIKRKKHSKKYLHTLMGGIRYFRKHRILKILAFDRVSIWILVFMLIWYYQPLLQQLGVGIIYFGFISAGITAAQIIILNKFEFLEMFFGSKRNYLLWSALIAGVGFILMGMVTYVPVLVVLFWIVAGFGLSRQALFQNYMNKHIESHNRATVISTVSMIEHLASGLVYLIIGILVTWSLNFAVVITGVFIIIFAVISRVEERHLID